MRKIWLPALISVLLVATMAAPALAGKELPFKAKADVVFSEPSLDCENGYVGDYSESIGTGTHLGRFHLSETLCLDFSGAPIIEFYVEGMLVAANGDELYFHVEDGVFNAGTGETSSSGWLFDGGTGRFESADGQASETLIRNSAGDLIGLTVVGWISFDASDRSIR